MRETIRLREGYVEVEDHGGFLFVREHGTLVDERELRFYTKHLERFIESTGSRKAIIDAREEVGEPSEPVRAAMWAWLEDAERGFDKVAFVLPTEMAVARVNMTALSRRAAIRAFDSVFEAQRWLIRNRSTTVRDLPPVRPRTSRPPLPSSTYHVSSGREERVGATPTDARRSARSDTRALTSSSAPPARGTHSDVHPTLRRPSRPSDDEERGGGSTGVA